MKQFILSSDNLNYCAALGNCNQPAKRFNYIYVAQIITQLCEYCKDHGHQCPLVSTNTLKVSFTRKKINKYSQWEHKNNNSDKGKQVCKRWKKEKQDSRGSNIWLRLELLSPSYQHALFLYCELRGSSQGKACQSLTSLPCPCFCNPEKHSVCKSICHTRYWYVSFLCGIYKDHSPVPSSLLSLPLPFMCFRGFASDRIPGSLLESWAVN